MHGFAGTRPRGWAALGIALAALALACDNLTRASGRAVDASGQPVAGALVILHRDGAPPDSLDWFSRTDSAGRFEAALHGGLGTPDAVLVLCAEGRGRAERRIPDGAWLRDLSVTMIAPSVGSRPAHCSVPAGAIVFR
jgi:hypothetical protein